MSLTCLDAFTKVLTYRGGATTAVARSGEAPSTFIAEDAVIRTALYELDNPLRVPWAACGCAASLLTAPRNVPRVRRALGAIVAAAYMSELSWSLRDRHAVCRALIELRRLKSRCIEGVTLRDLSLVEKRSWWVRAVDFITLDRTLRWDAWRPKALALAAWGAVGGGAAAAPQVAPLQRRQVDTYVKLASPVLLEADNVALRLYWFGRWLVAENREAAASRSS